ncbi:hypothetical protein GLOIN_2v1101511 [Rhizophagus clarus]|uniref:Uncharacterized protein n=1 Tax=Rhizophagus clarus TaxID=94130 RepID=A0A8H3QQK4_9GLOM|nr:hypothetical protein GLOIN_2v1101511 [Rhizophagus clarus]
MGKTSKYAESCVTNTSPNGSLKGTNPLGEIKEKIPVSMVNINNFAIPGPSNSNIDDDDEDLEKCAFNAGWPS